MRPLLIATLAAAFSVSSSAWASTTQPRPAPTMAPQAQEQILRAEVFLSSEKFEDAIKAFDEGNRLSGGKCFLCLEGAAATKTRLKRYDDAIADAREASRIAASKQEKARADNQLGLAFAGKAKKDEKQSRELKEAEEAFRTALRVDETLNAVRLHLARVLIREGRDKEADSVLAEYLKREPTGSNADQARALAQNHRRATELFAPEFKLMSLDGKTFTLESLKGRVVLLDFWATWCGPCHQALPELKAIQKRFAKEAFEIVSISVDRDRRALEAFVKKNEMTWPQLFDEGSRVAHGAFGINDFPSYVLLDPEGIVVYYARGYAPSTASRLNAQIEQALKRAGSKKAAPSSARDHSAS